jgi:hypothetical protein
MPPIAISGHRGMPAHSALIIEQAIRSALDDQHSELVGLSCIADGPDQIFARAVLDHGGTIEVIVPAERYRESLPEAAHDEYDALLAQAADVHRLPSVESDSDAHMAASAYMIDRADELWAVWDGKPARGYGGTADVVAYAREHGIPVRVIWPDGVTRNA